MKKIRSYSLRHSFKDKRTSYLIKDGKELPIKVDGIVMDSQFELQDGSVLIFLTEDSPYEEVLHIYLLSNDNQVLDSIEAGADFTPGVLKVCKVGASWVLFKFFTNDSVYLLEVTSDNHFILFLPPGWRYKRKLAKHRIKLNLELENEGEKCPIQG